MNPENSTRGKHTACFIRYSHLHNILFPMLLSNSTTYILSNFIRSPPTPALKPSNPRGSTPKVKLTLFSPAGYNPHKTFPTWLRAAKTSFLRIFIFSSSFLSFSQQLKNLPVLTLILVHFVLLTVYAHQTFGQYT